MIITTNMLKEKYHNYSNQVDKIKRETDKGLIIRLTKGIYETNQNISPFLLASSILSPSYLSFDWALSYYNLIPEKVCAITSATFKNHKNKTFENKFGRFEYSDVPSLAYPEGLTYVEQEGYIVKIAMKEKAVCDSICKWRVVKNVDELKELLFIDKRIDEDEFKTLDFKFMIHLASLYNKTNLKLLVKLIKKEYENE